MYLQQMVFFFGVVGGMKHFFLPVPGEMIQFD